MDPKLQNLITLYKSMLTLDGVKQEYIDLIDTVVNVAISCGRVESMRDSLKYMDSALDTAIATANQPVEPTSN
jgi:hypothetical protein